MKKLLLAMIALGGALCSFAQDSTGTEKVDTIRVGGMIIIKKKGDDDKEHREVVISNRRKTRTSNLSTNWWIVDLGFANLNDKTNYSSAASQAFAPGFSNKDQLNLRTGKSIDVNIWIFMQRLNMIKHVVNLKYGLGVELNNYRFDDERIRFTRNPTVISIDPALADVDKNKLAADYVTVPMMLNLNFTPNRKKGFGISGGVSAGYLYSARQKIKNNGDKDKLHDDFDLRKWKLSYIGELNLGPVRLYGSYAMKSMWEKGLDQTPYNVGIRLSNW
jgi:hypothetical protein